jgi:hypothetical protein
MRGYVYLVWVLEASRAGKQPATLRVLTPRTDAETQALLDRMGKVKQRMSGGCCYAVGTLVMNRAGGAGLAGFAG